MAVEDSGHTGAHINQDMTVFTVVAFFIFTISDKAEKLPTQAQNSLLSSDKPVSEQATIQINIFSVSLASLMLVSLCCTYKQSSMQNPSYLFIY